MARLAVLCLLVFFLLRRPEESQRPELPVFGPRLLLLLPFAVLACLLVELITICCADTGDTRRIALAVYVTVVVNLKDIRRRVEAPVQTTTACWWWLVPSRAAPTRGPT